MAKRGRKPRSVENVVLRPAPSPPVLSPAQNRRHSARLSTLAPTRVIRSPVRNVKPARNLKLNLQESLASTPPKNIGILSYQEQEIPVAPQLPPPQTFVERSVISVNYTQIGEREANYTFDPDEIESVNPDLALVNVGGYRVKEEFAQLLREIMRKYGDIGENSILKTKESIVYHLEKICYVFNELSNKNSRKFPADERKRLIDIVNDAAVSNIKVEWLENRLSEIDNAFKRSKEYKALKEKYAENSALIARIQEEQRILGKEIMGRKAEMDRVLGASFVRNLINNIPN